MCLWVDMCGYGFLYMCSSVQLCVAMGLLCVAMCAVSGYVWLWVAVCGYVWLWVTMGSYVPTLTPTSLWFRDVYGAINQL